VFSMDAGDRKGRGLVTQTLQTAEILDVPVTPPQERPVRPLPQLAVSRPRFKGILASIASALKERQLFVLLPFAMIGGLIVAVEFPVERQLIVLGAGAVLLVAAAVLSPRSLVWLRLVTLLAAFWVGLCLLPVHGALFGTPMLQRPVYGAYQARVDEIIEATPTEQRVVLSQIAPTARDRPVPVRRARVLIKAGPALAPGDMVSGSFRFAPVPGPVLPGGFDTQFHAFFDGIGAYGNSIRPPVLVSTGDDTAPERIVNAIRNGIAARIDAVLQQPAAGVARAIINGDQSAVSDETRTTMATAGIAHVLSVSGLHLTIVAGGVFWMLRLLLAGFDGIATRISVKRVAAVVGMIAALFYYGISGGNVAAFRSTLMILLVFGAVLVGRRALTMRNVAIAGIIVVLVDPASVFRPSFQLSFAAVAALVGAYENLRGGGGKDSGLAVHIWGYVKGIVVTSLIAGAATLLFSIYHFQQTSPLGVVGNLLTLPLVGFVMMPAALLAVLAMPFGVDQPFLLAMGWSVDRMLDMAAIVAGWSTHLRAAPLLTPLALLVGLAALCWFAFFKDRWRLLGPALAVPLVILLAVDHPPDVLIADTTKAMTVRESTGLALADGKPESFALDVWRDTYAEPITTAAEQSCDSIACVGTSTAGFSYAIVKDPAGFADECGRANLIVARVAPPIWCNSGTVIGPADLAAHGVHWLRWYGGMHRFEVRQAIGGLDRPWRITP
jgi:competence protein ComEC